MAGEGGRPATLYEPRFCFGAPRVPLHDLADWHNGLAFKNIDFGSGGLPVIKISEIKSGVGPNTARTNGRYSDDVRLRDGDLLFCWSGQPETSIGTYRWFGGEAWLNQHIFRVIPKPGINGAYLFALLRYLQPNFVQIAANKQTTGLGHVTKADLRALKVEIPVINEQLRIAEVVAPLDDKIELNRRIAQSLESIARVLFRSWFVDFDPVHAKAEGRSTGLPDDIAAHFPDSLDEDGIPSGWTKKPLSTIGRFLNGLALQKYPAKEGEPSLPVVKIAELRGGPTPKSARASINVPPDYVVNDGDHIFSWSGSLTHCRWIYGPGALNQHLFKVTALGVPAWLTYESVEQYLPNFQAIASGKAVTMGHIQRHHLDEALVAVPPAPTLSVINNVMLPLHDQLLALRLQSRTLSSIRDTLLSKLISGELRIAEAEQRVAAA